MKTILYLGLDPPKSMQGCRIIHYPVIRIMPKPAQEIASYFVRMPHYTHLIFTSKTSVKLFYNYLLGFGFGIRHIKEKTLIAVGKKTAKTLENHSLYPSRVAQNETAEGIIEVLESLPLKDASIFWPHSSLSRPILASYMNRKGLNFSQCHLYDTISIRPEPFPDLNQIDEIIFTSPSTVDAFASILGLPLDTLSPEANSNQAAPLAGKILSPIGPITEARLKEFRLI